MLPKSARRCTEIHARKDHESADLQQDANQERVVLPGRGERAECVPEVDDLMRAREADVSKWQCTVNSILSAFEAVAQAELDELKELSTLMSVDQGGQSRWEVRLHGERPILVTAPHCIYLLRDDDKPHPSERHTGEISQALAKELKGTCLQWNAKAQKRSQLLVAFHKRSKHLSLTDILDPRNRDPNYLQVEEVPNNPWFKQMLETASHWQTKYGYDAPMLHVDVHGCRDPPHTESHLTVGLGAMQYALMNNPNAVGGAEMLLTFKASLKVELTDVLSTLRLREKAAELVRVVIPNTKQHHRFAGAWAIGSNRCTQSQQAISFAGFSHAIQLEMSKVLREALCKDKAAIARFSNALQASWVKAKRAPGQPSGFRCG